jgi:uncharacterized protein with von Willebrand factor type A (vWA) domain
MLTRFFFMLREAGVPVSITELLALHEALEKRVADTSVDDFYYLSRACLVKDERYFDRYDQVFAAHFKGVEQLFSALVAKIPEDWLTRTKVLSLDDEEKARIASLGGWEKLMETLKQRLEEQKGRHQGGNKWIGTGGRSPFGTAGFNPEGVSIGNDKRGQGQAVKVWEAREYRNLDDKVELGTRNIKIALRKLRKFAREGNPEHLDLDETIGATARNAGLLDLKFTPERHNAIKVLLFLDVGGSMYPYVKTCEELFSAARSEFKHLEHYYFHNFFYDTVWKDNRRRHSERISTVELMRTYGHDYKVVIIGDASMSPYEITQPGGSVEHWNGEAGAVWIQRITRTWPHYVWLNPEPQAAWNSTTSIALTRKLLEDRMYPLTLSGLDEAIKVLKR